MGMVTFTRLRQRLAAAAQGKTTVVVEGDQVQGIRESGKPLNEVLSDTRAHMEERGQSVSSEGVPTAPGTERKNRENVKIAGNPKDLPSEIVTGNSDDGFTTHAIAPNAPETAATVEEATKEEGPVIGGKLHDGSTPLLAEGNKGGIEVVNTYAYPAQTEEKKAELEEQQKTREEKQQERNEKSGPANPMPETESEEASSARSDVVYTQRYSREELEDFTVEELRDLAEQRQIELPSRMLKADIIDVIFDAQKEEPKDPTVPEDPKDPVTGTLDMPESEPIKDKPETEPEEKKEEKQED